MGPDPSLYLLTSDPMDPNGDGHTRGHTLRETGMETQEVSHRGPCKHTPGNAADTGTGTHVGLPFLPFWERSVVGSPAPRTAPPPVAFPLPLRLSPARLRVPSCPIPPIPSSSAIPGPRAPHQPRLASSRAKSSGLPLQPSSARPREGARCQRAPCVQGAEPSGHSVCARPPGGAQRSSRRDGRSHVLDSHSGQEIPPVGTEQGAGLLCGWQGCGTGDGRVGAGGRVSWTVIRDAEGGEFAKSSIAMFREGV